MNNVLNTKRIGMVLRTIWIENKIRFLISGGLILLAYLLAIWVLPISAQGRMFGFGVFLTLFSYYSFVNKKVYRGKGITLTLPASTLEKYISLLITGIAYQAFFIAVHALSVTVRVLLKETGFISPEILWNGWTYIYGAVCFLIAYFLLAYVMFRRFSFLIGASSLIVILIIVIRLFAFWYQGQADLADSFARKSSFNELFTTVISYFNPIMAILSLVIFYLVYLKLKTQQVK